MKQKLFILTVLSAFLMTGCFGSDDANTLTLKGTFAAGDQGGALTLNVEQPAENRAASGDADTCIVTGTISSEDMGSMDLTGTYTVSTNTITVTGTSDDVTINVTGTIDSGTFSGTISIETTEGTVTGTVEAVEETSSNPVRVFIGTMGSGSSSNDLGTWNVAMDADSFAGTYSNVADGAAGTVTGTVSGSTLTITSIIQTSDDPVADLNGSGTGAITGSTLSGSWTNDFGNGLFAGTEQQ